MTAFRILFLVSALSLFVLSAAYADQCEQDLIEVFAGNYPGAKFMLDATGKSPEDLGNMLECGTVANATYCVVYAQAMINGSSPKIDSTADTAVPIALGLCLPSSCNVTYATELAEESLGKYYNLSRYVEVNSICGYQRLPLPARSIAVLAFVCFLVSLVVIGTAIDLMSRSKAEESLQINSVLPTPAVVSSSNIQYASSADNEDDTLLLKKRPQTMSQKVVAKLVFIAKCFSLPSNFTSFVKDSPGELNALNGLRVFSMLWIIAGHTAEFYAELVDNRAYITYIQSTFMFQLIPAAYWNVDTFFFLSGFLVAHSLRAQLNKKGRIPILLFYVHRLLRLWPTYLFILLGYIHLSIYVGEGFLWNNYSGYITQRCELWWTNMLFVNNFWPTSFSQQCLGWSWYLANDWQFYVISPLICFLYYKNKKLGFAFLILLLGANIGITSGLMVHYDLSNANPTLGFSPQYMDIIYGKPYCRIAPFLVGIATAWIYGERDKTRVLSWWMKGILYIVSLTTMWCLVFLTHTHMSTPWSMTEGIMYSAVGRVAWGIAVAALMYACFCDQQSFMNRLFSASIWGPFARLTFCAYLLHPIILFTYYLNRDHLLHFTNSDLVFWFVGAATLSYGLALCVSLLVEKPAMNLEKLLMPGHSTAKRPAVPTSGPVNQA